MTAPVVGPVVTAANGAFLRGRYGRKVRLETGLKGAIKAEAQTVEEVAELVRIARGESDGADPPDLAWGWLIAQGANVIQIDRPREILEYLCKHSIEEHARCDAIRFLE